MAGTKRLPQSFKSPGLEIPASTPKARLLCSVEGENATGKTELGLSQPDPLLVINYDDGLEGVIEKHIRKGRIIRVHSTRIHKKTKQEVAKERLQKLWEIYKSACQDPDVRSLFIDTGKELWEHIRLAYLGRLEKVPPIRYQDANAAFLDFIYYAFVNGKNLVISHPMKDSYVDAEVADKDNPGETKVVSMRTGDRERAGYKEMDFKIQIQLRLSKKGTEVPDKFRATVLKCRPKTELEGHVFRGSEVNFPEIAMAVFPDSDIDDWF